VRKGCGEGSASFFIVLGDEFLPIYNGEKWGGGTIYRNGKFLK
jgi:hypothetical protein